MRIKSPVLNKLIEKSKDQKIVASLLFFGFIAILYNFVFFISKNSVDIPFWDQWNIANIITSNASLFQILSYQHNEHRIGIGLFIMKVLAKYSDWNQIIEIQFVSFLVIASALLIGVVKYSISKKIEIFDILIPLIVLNIFQFENIAWGFQIAFTLPLFFLCLWVFSLKIKNPRERYIILTILSLLSSFSSFHGLILPVFTIILSFVEYFRYTLISKKLFILTAITNIFIIFLYFFGYTKNFQTAPSLSLSMPVIKYFSLAVSNGFFFSINNPPINILIATIVLSFFAVGIWKLLGSKPRNDSAFVGCILIFYSITFAVIISSGRSSLGIDQALSSRYVTFTMLIPIGLYFIFSSFKYGKYFKVILLLFIISNSIFLTDKSIKSSNELTEGKRQALACYKASTISNLDTCFKIFPLFPNKDYLNQRIIKVLQYKKISMFDKVDEIAYIINDLPNGKPEPIDMSRLFTNLQNISIRNDDFTSLNTDPNMLVTTNKEMRGISWRSAVTGKVRVYLTFDKKADFSEKYSFTITPLNSIYTINQEKIQEIMGKKIVKLRVDPTDKAETFKFSDLTIYK